jgi:hypothetical protein
MQSQFIGKVNATRPVVMHGSGGSRRSPQWGRMLAAEERLRFAPPPPEVSVVTWSNYDEPTLLERQFNRIGAQHRVLRVVKAFNRKTGAPDFYRIWGDKLRTLREAIPGIRTPYVMGLDSVDVLVSGYLGDPIRLMKDFYPSARMVFGGERLPWPANAAVTKSELEMSHGWYPYLNAGCWVAVTDFLRELLAKFPDRTDGDEQAYWKDVYIARFPAVRVDCGAVAFANLNESLDDFEVDA